MLAWIMNLDFAAGGTVVVTINGGELYLTFEWLWDDWQVT